MLALAAAIALPGKATPSASRSTLERAPSFPGGPYFAIGCGVSHRSNDDPIVFPGEPGRSHNHTFLGNRETDALSTPESLVGGRTTCDEPSDASAYWVPTLYERGHAVTPLAAIVYYTNRSGGEIVAPPPGLVLLAGDADARSRQPKGIVAWSCGAIGGRPRFHVIPACRPNELLQLQVTFPSCWTGRSPDSPDHRQHVRYPRAGACPATHPVALPTISLIVLYPPVAPRTSQLSSGRLGAHADFLNGWRQEVLERLVAERSVRARR
ncbi:MAG: DUF1996 domain-containing protein [Thermoleophilia bacterium]|nr:DUF1996 domain-containing protein [Gaiellaceae bacterium]MDW8338891.1 DUF1996 domain-containing protein [Thermoleophilia bacterium]